MDQGRFFDVGQSQIHHVGKMTVDQGKSMQKNVSRAYFGNLILLTLLHLLVTIFSCKTTQ